MAKTQIPGASSESVENYLKAVYQLSYGGRGAGAQEIAVRLGVSTPAASRMARHLAGHGLVTHMPHRRVHLTELGDKIALEVIRHHRLLELYLVEALGYSWHEVHAEAERLEHYISEEFEERIDRLMGYPSFDPHGDPIPARDGRVLPPVTATLDSQAVDDDLVVRRMADEDEGLLVYLADRGIKPGTHIRIVGREEFGGSLQIQVGDRQSRITPLAAQHVFVERATQALPDSNDDAGLLAAQRVETA